MLLVSACLLGINSKYDGSTNTCQLLLDYAKQGKIIPVCPEQLGGSQTPRNPAEIKGGTGDEVLLKKAIVIDSTGMELTTNFIKGAEEVLRLTTIFPIQAAILKERSPSCGCLKQYDGSFSHKLIPGQGVCTALLRKNGITVYSEESLTAELLDELLS